MTDLDKYLDGRDDGWYFWDESWAFAYGPFPTKDMAIETFKDYCDTLNREDEFRTLDHVIELNGG